MPTPDRQLEDGTGAAPMGAASPSRRYFHGTTARRFQPGDELRPSREVGRWSNWSPHEHIVRRELASGRKVHAQEVVWVTSSVEEAWGWAHHSTLKATQAEIRQMPAGGLAVYEVEPLGLELPLDPHGEGEAACVSARVLREVRWEPFPQDLCDACGELASVGLGSEEQLCESCAKEER